MSFVLAHRFHTSADVLRPGLRDLSRSMPEARAVSIPLSVSA